MNVFSSRQPAGKQTKGTGLLLVALCLLATMLFPTTEASAAAARCNGLVVTINMNNGDSGNGTNGNDVILGTPGRDTIQGRGGNDTICGEGGSDRIRGHAGNDTILAGSGNDQVWGGPGNDDLRGMGGHDTMWGDSGRDTMQGNSGNDTLHGGASHDTISGSTGNDVIYGEGGWDKINGGDGNDIADGGDGNDTISGQAGDDTLDGAAGNDTINGGPGTNNCTGETLTNCGPYSPPDWTSNSELKVSAIRSWDSNGVLRHAEFDVEWCCSSGPQVDRYDLIVRREDGEERLFRTYPPANSITIDNFDNQQLERGALYEVEVRAVNNAGASTPLTTVGGVPRQFTAAPIVRSTAAFNAGREDPDHPCSEYTTAQDFGGEMKIDDEWQRVTLGTHVATTHACHNGTAVTLNDPVTELCTASEIVELITRDDGVVDTGGSTGAPRAVNHYICRVHGALDAGVNFGFFRAGTKWDFEIEQHIQHEVEWAAHDITFIESFWVNS